MMHLCSVVSPVGFVWFLFMWETFKSLVYHDHYHARLGDGAETLLWPVVVFWTEIDESLQERRRDQVLTAEKLLFQSHS